MTEHMFNGAAMVSWLTDEEGNILDLSITTLDDPEVLDEADEDDEFGSDEDVLVKMIPNLPAFVNFVNDFLPGNITVNIG
jgi:hypothetical protein